MIKQRVFRPNKKISDFSAAAAFQKLFFLKKSGPFVGCFFFSFLLFSKTNMATVYIIIYSLYHHIYKVAKDVQKGLESEGVTVKLFQVSEEKTKYITVH